jgi:hypothetical protein
VSRQNDTDYFYELMDVLSSCSGGPRHLRDVRSSTGWPRHGVYFFFEPGEVRRNESPRVVRVGTHALRSNSKTTLWRRLAQHRGYVGGQKPGGGNHRASIFRLHVGAALINRGDLDQMPLSAWLARRPMPDYREAELLVERAVSDYIGRMPLLWVAVPTREDGTSDRSLIEANSIALLSTTAGGLDAGKYAANIAVRSSGLWNVNHIADHFAANSLEVLTRYVTAQAGG